MKKLTLMLLAAVGAAVLMTGCGKEKAEPAGSSVGTIVDQKTDQANKDFKKAGDDAAKGIKKSTDQVDKDLKTLGDKLKK